MEFFPIAAGVSAAAAQSIDIPLQLDESSGASSSDDQRRHRRTNSENVLFDTGSGPFNAFYSPSAFGSVPGNMASPSAVFPHGLPTAVRYSYGSGYTYTGNFVGVPSLRFYPNSSVPANSPTGVTLNAITPSGAPSDFIINAIYNRSGHGTSGPITLRPRAFRAFSAGSMGFSVPAILRVSRPDTIRAFPVSRRTPPKPPLAACWVRPSYLGRPDMWWRPTVSPWRVCRPGRRSIPAHTRTVLRSVRPSPHAAHASCLG